jgi:integrase
MRSHMQQIVARLGWLHVAELRQAHIRTYIAQRRADWRKDGTIREDLSKLRSALKWGAKEGHCDYRPFSIPLAGSLRARWLDRAECVALLSAARAPHIRLLILVCLHTAARLSAALELTWGLVDFERGVVDLGHKPGGKARAVVPMTRTLRTALEEAKAQATTQWVIEYAGRRLVSGQRAWEATRLRAGLPDITRHDLRRTCGSLMLQEGVPIERVAAFLGHKDTRTTLRVYAHLAVEHLRDAANVLDR